MSHESDSVPRESDGMAPWNYEFNLFTVFDLISEQSAKLAKFVGKNKNNFFYFCFLFLNYDLISGPSTSGHVWRHLLDDQLASNIDCMMQHNDTANTHRSPQ